MQEFSWGESDEAFFKMPANATTTTELPMAKSKAPAKGAAEAKAGSGQAPKSAAAAVPGSKPMKQSPTEPIAASTASLTLTGLDTAGHAAVGPAFSNAGMRVHEQFHMVVRDMEQKFKASAAEEGANADRWQECLRWLHTPWS